MLTGLVVGMNRNPLLPLLNWLLYLVNYGWVGGGGFKYRLIKCYSRAINFLGTFRVTSK